MTDDPQSPPKTDILLETLVSRAMQDLDLPIKEWGTLSEQDQYRVLDKILDYNREVLTKLNEDMQAFVARMDQENTTYERIRKAKEERRYVTTYEDRVQ